MKGEWWENWELFIKLRLYGKLKKATESMSDALSELYNLNWWKISVEEMKGGIKNIKL